MEQFTPRGAAGNVPPRKEAVLTVTQETKSHQATQARLEQEALDALARLGGDMFGEDDILREGRKIMIPQTMSLQQAVEFINHKIAEEEEVAGFSRVFKYRVWDVAYCAHLAFKKAFGAVRHKGSFMSPPQLIDIPNGPDSVVQVPWGNFVVPHLPEVTFTVTGARDAEFGHVGAVRAEGPKKWRFHVEGIFKLIEEELRRSSLYKGKVIDGAEMPNFRDPTTFDPERLVYSDEVFQQLETNVFAPLRYPEKLRAAGIDLKGAVLLEGNYGVGKSEFLRWASQVAYENSWTFIFVRPQVDDIEDAMRTARIYAPAVIAFEDVDTIADASSESDRISRILELFDGTEAKSKDVMVLLTTNHVDVIHKGMLRPGRLDAIIHVSEPDAEAIAKLCQVFIPEDRLKVEEAEWPEVSEAMVGFLPAFVREACDRAIKYSVVRNEGELGEITKDDLVGAARGLRDHYNLMTGAADKVEREPLQVALERHVRAGVTQVVDERLLSANGETELG